MNDGDTARSLSKLSTCGRLAVACPPMCTCVAAHPYALDATHKSKSEHSNFVMADDRLSEQQEGAGRLKLL